jgi:hypothetical protein
MKIAFASFFISKNCKMPFRASLTSLMILGMAGVALIMVGVLVAVSVL